MKTKIILWLAIPSVAVLWSCAKPGEQEYFPPLRDGAKREYSVQCATLVAGVLQGRLVWRIDGSEAVNGKTYFKEVRVTTGIPGVPAQLRYLRRDEQGIHAIDGNDKTRTEYLEVPFPVKVGNSWTVKSQDGETRFRAEAIETLRLSDRKYDRCLKVSYKSAKGEGYSYFAPAIGDVKGVIKASGVTVEYALDKR